MYSIYCSLKLCKFKCSYVLLKFSIDDEKKNISCVYYCTLKELSTYFNIYRTKIYTVGFEFPIIQNYK